MCLRNQAYMQRIKNPRNHWFSFLYWKLCYLLLFILVPWLATEASLLEVLGAFLLMATTSSLTFVLTIALNHFVVGTEFFENPRLQSDSNLEHQFLTCADWNPYSKWACWLMGGANAHVAHHLFPHLSHRHYHEISKKLPTWAANLEVPYHRFGFLRGLQSHFRFLYLMGRAPNVI